MRRIVIYGCSGSGKSTLAVRLGQITGLPVTHIDQLYWRPSWVPAPKAEFLAAMEHVVAQDRWIIDGCNLSTFPMRLPRADTFIWLQRSRFVCLWRVLKRVATIHGRRRPDSAEGCPERFDLKFLIWIWNFERTYAGQAEALLAAHGAHLRVVTLRSDMEAAAFLRAPKLA